MLRIALAAAFVAVCLCASASVAQAAPPGSGWRLHFADEFSGDTIDSLKWQTRYPWGRTHNHIAYMEDDAVVMGDGTATLVATREENGDFTSGVISTGYSKYTADEGYIEARILLPNTTGSWPAFWGLYTGWPPEADIMEYPIGAYTQSEYHTAYHYSTGGGGSASGAGKVNPGSAGDLGSAYHTFGMEWVKDDYVTFYFDGVAVSGFGTDSAIAEMEQMYLILNYAVGGWPGTPSQSEWANGWQDRTKIDWVRVWQREETATSIYSYNGSDSGSWGGDDNWRGAEPQHSRAQAYFDTLADREAMSVTWNQLKTVGEVYLDGDTAYTIGDGAGSLMLADDGDGWARLWVDGGAGGHVVDARLEAWSHLSLKNDGASSLTINGAILGHAREGGAGGEVLVRGGGEVILNGLAYTERLIEISEGATLTVNAGVFQGSVDDSAGVLIGPDSSLRLASLNDRSGSLGRLPGANQHVEFDGGVLEVLGDSSTRRGMSVGAAGATLVAGAEFEIRPSYSKGFETDGPGVPLRLAGGGDGSISRDLAAFDRVEKSGSGSWTIHGDGVSETLETSVLEGTLVVNGRLGGLEGAVSAGARLGGQGSLVGGLVNAGVVAPGQVGGAKPHHAETTGRLAFDFTGVQDDAPLIATQEQSASVELVEGLAFSRITFPADSDNAGDEFNVAGWTPGKKFDDALAEESFISYTVAAVEGLEMQLDTVQFEVWRNGWYAPTHYAILTDQERLVESAALGSHYVLDPDDGDAADGSDLIGFEHRTWVSGEYTGSDWTSDPIEIRLYGWAAGSSTGHSHVTGAEMTANFRSVAGDVMLLPTGRLTIEGDFEHVAGATLAIELAGADNSDLESPQYDSLNVSGEASVYGDLAVTLLDGYAPVEGDVFDILDAGSIDGVFEQMLLPELGSGLWWDVSRLMTSGELVVAAGTLTGDFNGDGVVNAGDYTVWRAAYGSADESIIHDAGVTDGVVDEVDFAAWRDNYGATTGSTFDLIPEPTGAALIALGIFAAARPRFPA